MWVNTDPRVRALMRAAQAGYGSRGVEYCRGMIIAAMGRMERGETRLSQEVKRLERPLRFW